MNEYAIIAGAVAFCAGFGIAFWAKGLVAAKTIRVAEEEAGRVVKDAERRSETLLREAEIEGKDLLFRMKSEFEAETKETRSVLKTREQRLLQKEENVDRKLDQFEKRDHDFTKKENQLQNKIDEVEKKENEYQELVEEQKNQLEKISGLTAEQAKRPVWSEPWKTRLATKGPS
jgi:ribonuclease Y